MFRDMRAHLRRIIIHEVNLKFVGSVIVSIKQNGSRQIINVHKVAFKSVKYVPRPTVRESFI